MKLIITSDTEGDHREAIVPHGDVFIFGGDLIAQGSPDKHGTYESQLNDFIDWLDELPHKHKIFIGGNHDGILNRWDKKLPKGIHYLENESIVLDGIKYWGSPNTVAFFGMPFELPEEKLIDIYDTIPDDVDVLITHVPPYGVLDESSGGKNCGSQSLSNRVDELNPRVHIFGHIHNAYGRTVNNGIESFNASFQYDRNPVFTIDI